MKTITIDPVTRIEGHSRITLQLDDNGRVTDARFHVTQVRGFEKLTEGRPFSEMPAIVARICGICPVSHLIASSKACDAIMAVQIPETGAKLLRIMNLAQIVQSHALSFFHLSSPDLLLGMDADPAERNIFGVIRKHPDIARGAIRLRQFGQQVIETLGGKRVHPGWIVPGGVSHPLEATQRGLILAQIPEVTKIAHGALTWFKGQIESFRAEIRTFANFPSLFMALANEQNEWASYSGWLRVIDADGKIVTDHIEGERYRDYIGEYVNDDSYLKSAYYKPLGYPSGLYRVGPLARLNVCKSLGTPAADEELAQFRELERHTVLSSFYYHYARLIEVLFALERMDMLLNDPEILSDRVRGFAAVNSLRGIGITEAPRGPLIHDYTVDENGLIRNVNLIIATGHNNMAINKGILQAAKHFVNGDMLQEGMLNRVEAVVRCYDPCLSCSTHALGHMALKIDLLAPDGQVLDSIARE
jgi:NAD-reducing hydrogenase large subunit